jgi:hypothetical protein
MFCNNYHFNLVKKYKEEERKEKILTLAHAMGIVFKNTS